MSILDTWPASVRSALAGAQSQVQGFSSNQGSTDPALVSSNRRYLVQITQEQQVKTINSDGSPIIVYGQAPEDFQLDQAVAWKAPWAAGLAGEGLVSDLLAVTRGTRLLAQVQTLKVWQGSSNDVSFTINFELRAWSDVDRDVMTPLFQLSSLALPSVDPSTGWLRSPGPVLDSDGVKEITGQLVSAISTAGKNAGNAFLDKLQDGGSKLAATVDAAFGAVQSTGRSLGNAKSVVEKAMKNKIEVRIGDWFRLSNAIITNVQHTWKTQMPGPDGGFMGANVTVTFEPMFAMTIDDMRQLIQTSAQRYANSGQHASQATSSGLGTTFGA